MPGFGVRCVGLCVRFVWLCCSAAAATKFITTGRMFECLLACFLGCLQKEIKGMKPVGQHGKGVMGLYARGMYEKEGGG
jgi:hypothetical protein